MCVGVCGCVGVWMGCGEHAAVLLAILSSASTLLPLLLRRGHIQGTYLYSMFSLVYRQPPEGLDLAVEGKSMLAHGQSAGRDSHQWCCLGSPLSPAMTAAQLAPGQRIIVAS